MPKQSGGGFDFWEAHREQKGGGRGRPPRPFGGGGGPRGHGGGMPRPPATPVHVRPLLPNDTLQAIRAPFPPATWCDALRNNVGGPLNPSLLFTRFIPQADKKFQPAILRSLAATAKDPDLAKEIETRQQLIVNAWKERRAEIVEIRATQTSRLISRLGEHHPYENGFMFHPLYGVPFLPGSGIKGAVRAALTLELAGKAGLSVPDELAAKGLGDRLGPQANILRDLFGTAGKEEDSKNAGRVVAMDAFPVAYELETDILTPHFRQYYPEGKRWPTDDEGPNPVTFLAVKAGARWVFRLAILPARLGAGTPDARDRVERGLRSALTEWGLGAKKSSGYGIFRPEA